MKTTVEIADSFENEGVGFAVAYALKALSASRRLRADREAGKSRDWDLKPKSLGKDVLRELAWMAAR